MRHSRSSETLESDPKIGRTFRRLLKERRDQEKTITDQEERRDYVVPSLIGATHASLHQRFKRTTSS